MSEHDGRVPVRAAARTDVGRARERNEDAFFSGQIVFAVADGLGGHAAGDVASRTALEPVAALDREAPAAAAERLASAVRAGNKKVFEQALGDAELRGMGTTMTAVALHDGVAHLAHVGDSRCYLIRGGAITQVSEDHTVVARLVKEGRLTAEQAEHHPQRSMILRALGSEEMVVVDETDVPVQGGDRLLLCSDGLTGVVGDQEICDIAGGESDLEAACEELIDLANQRGGPDNITIVLVEIGGDASASAAAASPVAGTVRVEEPYTPARPGARPRISRRALVWLAVIVLGAVGAFVALKAIVGGSYYVGVDGGRVAIFRGLPSTALDPLSSVVERSEITVDEVAEYYRPRLDEGVRATSLEDARSIVAAVPREPGATPSPTPAASPTATPSPGGASP